MARNGRRPALRAPGRARSSLWRPRRQASSRPAQAATRAASVGSGPRRTGRPGPAKRMTRRSRASGHTRRRVRPRSRLRQGSPASAAARTDARPASPARSGGARSRETMSGRRDPRVDDYIARLPDWQQAICRRVRDLVHEADPEIEETIKRTVQPYFVLHGNVAALLATKDHVNVFLYDPIAPDPAGIVTAGHDNKTGRQIAIYRDDTINEPALLDLFRAIIANNRAGGWRKLIA